jgi:hypothetical protein
MHPDAAWQSGLPPWAKATKIRPLHAPKHHCTDDNGMRRVKCQFYSCLMIRLGCRICEYSSRDACVKQKGSLHGARVCRCLQTHACQAMWMCHSNDLAASEEVLGVIKSTTVRIAGNNSNIRSGVVQSVFEDGHVQIPELRVTRQAIFAAGIRTSSCSPSRWPATVISHTADFLPFRLCSCR